MKYKYLLLFLFLSNLSAYNLEELWQWYKNAQYGQICSKQVAFHDYYKYNENENFINMYAHSCLKIDMINRLAIPIVQLRQSKQSRANSTYYATILYQKKLLYQALIDGGEILLPRDLPDTNYILSKIYNDFANKRYRQENTSYIFQDGKDKNITYKLFMKNDNGIKKIVLQTIHNSRIAKIRMYW